MERGREEEAGRLGNWLVSVIFSGLKLYGSPMLKEGTG